MLKQIRSHLALVALAVVVAAGVGVNMFGPDNGFELSAVAGVTMAAAAVAAPDADKLKEEAAKAKAALSGAIVEANAPMVKALEDLVTQLKSGAGAVVPPREKGTSNMDPDPGRPAITGKLAKEGTGIMFARVLKAQWAKELKGVKGVQNGEDAAEVQLRNWGYTEEANALKASKVKAMEQGTFVNGGALVPAEYSSELIALLRNVTAVRKMGIRTFPMGASLEFPRQTAAGSATWVGENTAIQPGQPQVGSDKLMEKKLASLVVFSNDFARNAFISGEEFIRDDMLQVIAQKEDVTALYSPGGQYAPRGLVSMVAAANQYNATAANQTAPTLAEIKRELANMIRRVMEGNIPMTSMGFIISPRTWAYLFSVTDGGGNAVFESQLLQGRLMGHPVIVTNQVVNNETWSVDGSTDVSRIFFGDWAQFLIGESMGLELEVFPNAAYDVNGTVVSGISRDQSVIRGLLKEDFLLRYNTAFVIVKTRMGA